MPVIFRKAGTIVIQNDKPILPVQVYFAWDGGQSALTPPILAGRSLTIDVSDIPGLTSGSLVRPYLDVDGGRSNFPADTPFTFVAGAGSLTYVVSGEGPTLTFNLQQ